MEIIVGIARGLLAIVGVLVAFYAIPYMAARGAVDGIRAAGGIDHSVTVVTGGARLTGGSDGTDKR